MGITSTSVFIQHLEPWRASACVTLVWGALFVWVWSCQRLDQRNVRELSIWLHVAGNLRIVLPQITKDNQATASLVTVGPGFAHVLGFQPTEMEGRPWTEFVHPDDFLIESGGSDRLASGGQMQCYSNRWRHKNPLDNGEIRWVWLEWNAYSDPVLGKTYACGRDITGQFQHEGQMATWSRITNDLMATTMADPAVPTHHCRFNWVNEAWPRLLGLSIAEVYNKRISDLVHPDDLGKITAHRDGAGAEIEPKTTECRILCRMKGAINGYRLYEWSSIALNGRLYLTGRDVEAEKVHRREMAKAIYDLESRNKDLERFASVAAHQLRSPPRTITGIAQALKEDYGHLLDEDGLQFLEDIRTDANQMAEIVDGLFRFSKVRTSDDLSIKPVDLNAVMLDISKAVAKKRCSVCPNGPTCPNAKDIPPQCPRKREIIKFKNLPVVLGDRLLIREVLMNLIDNGMKFNESDEKWVEVTADRCSDRWCIKVTDNGIGIDPLYHNKLFTMFERVHPSYPGTGVGLALVAAIVNKFGGTIKLESNVGSGSTFTFDLKEIPASLQG